MSRATGAMTLSLICGLLGCASIDVVQATGATPPSRYQRILVKTLDSTANADMPILFGFMTRRANGRFIVSEKIAQALVRAGKVAIPEAAILGGREDEPPPSFDAIIMGALDEYYGTSFSWLVDLAAAAEVHLVMVDAQSGEIVWSAGAKAGGMFYSPAEAAERIARDVVAASGMRR